ncbi:MAG: hypothetical protein KKF30_19115, partial [Proteobacteria bacterium]|nr:hypothetical protein [Pseudomonadota bacterium]
TGAFTSSMTGLSSITTYYVRAYATNGAGTVYGNEVNFTTAALNSPQNLIGVETAGEFTLTWDPVDGATGYKVYACEEPYGVFQDVTNEGNFNGESWSYTYSEQKRFFYVVAQDDTKKK